MEALTDERTASGSERVTELRQSIEAGAFWAAVVLPVGYVPFLTMGIEGADQAVAFAAFVALHFAALAAGHAYGR
jgi:hypothetical protein